MQKFSYLPKISLISILFCLESFFTAMPSYSEPLFKNINNYDRVLVEKILSPDLILLKSQEKIRLIGVKAPKTPKKKKVKRNEYNIILKEEASPLVSLYDRAFLFSRKLMEGKYVRIEFDIQRRGDDFCSIAYAFLEDGTFVNAEILRNGYADLSIVQPNTKYEKELRAAYQEAREEKRGLQGQ